MRRRRTLVLMLLLLAGGAGAWLWWHGGLHRSSDAADSRADAAGSGRRGRPPRATSEAVPVLVATAERADVPVLLDGIGTVQAYKTVTVRPQVSGKLLAVDFDEGTLVKKGDLLAKIDPVLYQAAYDEAVARRAMDQALLENAKRDLDRYVNLAKTDYATKQQADTSRATVGQLLAQLRQDQALIDSAKANLDYTDVRAPIDGRTGIRQVDEGNLVSSTDTAGIVVITQLQPISAVFTLPETALGKVNGAVAAGAVPVEAQLGGVVQDRGTIEVVDNRIDQTTGTVRIKAIFPNAASQLWPGQFVNVKVRVRILEGATVVPVAAVQQGPSSRFVYLLTPGQSARLQDVEVAQEDERIAVIASGVALGDKVITTGFSRLRDGAKVAPDTTPAPPVASAVGAAATVR